MGVYVKGMEMPPACGYCRLAWCCKAAEGECIDLRERNSYRHRNCPLVEIKKPHGRLIDADEIIMQMNEMKVKGETFTTAVNYVKEINTNAPTVIESEE